MDETERRFLIGQMWGYYLSKFDVKAYERLGYPTNTATYEALGSALGVSPLSIRSWRDEFDPIHENKRRGYVNREMHPSRKRVAQALCQLSEPALLSLLREATSHPSGTVASTLIKEGAATSEAEIEESFSARGLTGKLAEDYFRDHHARTSEPTSGELLDRRYDGRGFDFEIKCDGASVFVEVKGLAGTEGGISFTDKEWEAANELAQRYFLALVRDVGGEPQVTLFQNPAALFNAKKCTYTVLQVSWAVSAPTLRSALG